MTSSKVIKCRAAVCWAIGEPLKIEDIEVEPPHASEVRIKLLCSSLCHTDIHYWKDEHPTLFPKVLGHEGVGVVESVGEGVTDLKEGDFVIPTYLGECHECQNCISKKTNLCSKYMLPFSGLMLDNTSRMSCKGQKLYHVFTCATWAEYTVVNVNYLVKMDPRLQLEHASLMSCGVSTGIGAAWKEANMEKGSTVAVFGLGAVGLGVILGAKLMGASKIIGVDLNEWKQEKGEELGMTDFINPAKDKKSISEIITEMTGGVGVDYCFECTGVEPLLNQALGCVAMGRGVAIAIGVGMKPTAPISVVSLVLGRTLKGSIFGGLKPPSDLPFVMEKAINKEIKLDTLVTHEVKLDEINHALGKLATQADCIKVVIQMSNY